MVMSDKQLIFNRIVMSSLGLVTLISICIGGANVLFEIKRDVVRIENQQIHYETTDEKKWDKAWVEIDATRDKVHKLELQNTRIETNQKEILRRLDELFNMLSKFEVVK
jgi:hypothetical protein